MISLGVDISTKKIAIAGIRRGVKGFTLVTRSLDLSPDARGARRLVGARMIAYASLGGHNTEAAIIVVEAPINKAQNYELLAIANVVEEAAQSACQGAVVMSCPPATWKLAVLGRGNATKDDALAFAHGLGYVGDDDDIADALCLAQLGWNRWDTRRAAA